CLNDEVDEVRVWACAGLERITGVVNRAPLKAVSSESDVPLWGQWCKLHQNEFVQLVNWDGSGLRRDKIPQKQRLGDMQLQRLWDDLAASESAKAYRAMEALVAAPEQAVTLFKDRLLRVDPVKERQIAKCIADLDDADFKNRELASQELEKHGFLAQKEITKALGGAEGAEGRRRLEKLQARLNSSVVVTMPATLRLMRAVAVLEEIRSSEIRQVLEKFASGPSEDFLTQEARAA